MSETSPHPRSSLSKLARWLGRAFPGRKARPFRVRVGVQLLFALTCLLLGIQFARFTAAARAGVTPLPHRPPGAEGFLPISGLMGLLDWFYQGQLNVIHPAATVLFIIFVVLAIALRKAFCSWICPVGLISEALARLGRTVFGRNFRPWRWIDVPLRSLKYLLLGFFVWAIAGMGPAGLRSFIEGDYNHIADVKMYLFFAELGATGAIVLALLAVLSVPIQGAWCRYLCPYGALLGLVSWISPVKIRRDAASCTDCGHCDRVCMARLPVSTSQSISSPECTGCLDCVSACPSPPTLTVGPVRRSISPLAFAGLVLGLFLAGYAGARIGGLWENSVDDARYIELTRGIEQIGHPGR